jgi:hypothetical protein
MLTLHDWHTPRAVRHLTWVAKDRQAKAEGDKGCGTFNPARPRLLVAASAYTSLAYRGSCLIRRFGIVRTNSSTLEYELTLWRWGTFQLLQLVLPPTVHEPSVELLFGNSLLNLYAL